MRALVLSGGSVKGVYETGALKYMLGELELKYDILCGVSVGSLNSSFLSMYPHGSEKESINDLVNFWNKITIKDIYKNWKPFGIFNILWENSFFDASPFHNLVRKNLNIEKIRKSGKIVSVGAVSLTSGKYTSFDQTSEYFIDAVIGSSSFPGILPPIKFDNQLWIDGGVKTISPTKTAIELGATSIDIIMTSPKTRIHKFIKKPSIIDILKRTIDLSCDKIMSNDIEKLEMHNQLVKAGVSDKKFIDYRVIRPQFNLIEDLFNFDKNKIQEMMDKGYADAKVITNY